MSKRVRRLCAVVLVGMVLSVVVTPAAAQGPRAEVAGGYQFMRDAELEESFPAGWFASGAIFVNDWLALVGEMAGSQNVVESDGREAEVTFHSYAGGVRYYRRLTRVTPFAQLLVGGVGFGVELFEFDADAADAALQPGGGIDVHLNERFFLRFAGDYRRVFSEEGANQFRFIVGAGLGFGRR